MSELHAFVAPPGVGEVIRSPIAGPMLLKARSETTGGSFAFLENEIAPGSGPALHRHTGEDEMYYVLDGTFRFKFGQGADSRIERAETGAFVFIPRGTPHCFQNIGDQPGRFLVMFTPSGMERYFERQAELPADAMQSDAHREIAADAGMEVLGPPLSVSDPLGS